MITSDDFGRVEFKRPWLNDDSPVMENIRGIDSESYYTGEPFMLCDDEGRVIEPRGCIERLFSIEEYNEANFMVYNLKYDSGALLYYLPREVLHTLWDEGEAIYESDQDYGPVKISYIPHKCLRFYCGSVKITFWDISQFYHMSLNHASKRYLNRKKIDIPTKKFSHKYVKRFWKYIARYCIQDAKLTADLGKYLIDKLQNLDIKASSLYSCASISFKYFCSNTSVITGYKQYCNQQKLFAYACDAYEGGKFEVTGRGAFYGYEYDITSAYPYEIRNLVDISESTVIYSKKYRRDAQYGFLRVRIHNIDKFIPCGIMQQNVRFYPSGIFFTTITKEEYDYLVSINIEVDIIDGAWVIVKRKRYPYKKVIDTLFDIKTKSKGNDDMIYNVSKIIMNSFYGKCVQTIEDNDGIINLGPGFNPVYGSIITANTRIKVTKMQNILKDNCLAVHTDSIITSKKVPKKYIKNRLGEFEYVTEGNALLVACGMYQIGDTCAYKGFIAEDRETWESILSRSKTLEKISYPQTLVESWIEVMAKNHPRSNINLFRNDPKKIDLNCDTKRTWMKKTNAKQLLNTLERGANKIFINDKPQKWEMYL